MIDWICVHTDLCALCLLHLSWLHSALQQQFLFCGARSWCKSSCLWKSKTKRNKWDHIYPH